jgi:cytochrome c-type biogenesis protein CcmH/NrfG
MWSNILDRISYLALFLVIVLLPVFFLPFTKIPVETSKGLLLVAGLGISVIFWAVARFSNGKISIPRSNIIFANLAILLVVLVSAFFSSARAVSFFGTIFDIGTFWFMFVAFLLLFICSVMIKDNKNAQMVLFGTILSTVVVMVFQTFRFFWPAPLSLGVLGSSTENILGSWNALGIMAGFSCLTSLFVIEFFSITKIAKIIFGVLIALSLFIVASVNFILVWELVGIFALFIFVYKISFFSQNKEESTKIHFPGFSFAVVMVSLLFFMSSQFIGTLIPNRLSLANTEVSPSFNATMLVAKESLKKSPILGIGPNRFGELWAMYRPASINNSIFWDISFNSGSGLIPTLALTTGYLGIFSWLLFFVLFIRSGLKALFSNSRSANHRETIGFFILALYLFVASFFYSTGPVLFLLALAFTGIFIGLHSNREKGEVEVNFLDDHRKSFFFILSLVLVMVLSAAASFKYVERFASVSYFGKAVQADTIPNAEASIAKALSLHTNDLYMRAYAQVYLVKLNSLLNKESTSLSDEDKAALQASFDQALSGAVGATAYNSNNYLNYQSLGNVYSIAGAIGVKDAYSKAEEAYINASKLNPLNPGIELSIARAYFSNGKIKDAKELANKALALKPDYLDALVMLSQISKSEGNSTDALSYAERALSISPTNKDLIKYVDSLKGGN